MFRQNHLRQRSRVELIVLLLVVDMYSELNILEFADFVFLHRSCKEDGEHPGKLFL